LAHLTAPLPWSSLLQACSFSETMMASLASGCRMAVARVRARTVSTLRPLALSNGAYNGCFQPVRALAHFDVTRRSIMSWRGADIDEDMLDVDELFENNEDWRHQCVRDDPEFFEKMSDGQRPRYLWIGCSDSRVPPEHICGMPPGSLFVHRNIANVIGNTDVSAMSVVQYAVTVLKVQHIVICGHYNCGGIAASMENVDHHSPLENWLRNIRDVYRLHAEELDAIPDKEQRARRLVEVNVIEQAINIYKTRVVQSRRVETYKNLDEYQFVQPKIHPVVYEPGTGELRRLSSELKEKLQSLTGIYNLYSLVDEDNELEFDGMGPSTVTP